MNYTQYKGYNYKISLRKHKGVVVDKGRNLIIKFNNGDRLTLYKSDYSKKVRRHLLRTFNGEHLD
jgi:hypothetical protein